MNGIVILIFYSCVAFIVFTETVNSLLISLIGRVLTNMILPYLIYFAYVTVLSIGCCTICIVTFGICDIVTVYYNDYLRVSSDLNLLQEAPLAVERLPNYKIMELPHPDRMINNPWATTGAILVGVLIISKIIIRFFF